MNKEMPVKVPDCTCDLDCPEFWELYDSFCSKTNLELAISGIEARFKPQALIARMQNLMKKVHMERSIHHLKRAERGWNTIHAWLVLRDASIQKYDGGHGIDVRLGDVVIVEHGWDRDVIITHVPINPTLVSGYLLSGKWEPMVGLFMPLYDKETIMRCIELRLKLNIEIALAEAQNESINWGWY